jgi:hypothetical protein
MLPTQVGPNLIQLPKWVIQNTPHAKKPHKDMLQLQLLNSYIYSYWIYILYTYTKEYKVKHNNSHKHNMQNCD